MKPRVYGHHRVGEGLAFTEVRFNSENKAGDQTQVPEEIHLSARWTHWLMAAASFYHLVVGAIVAVSPSVLSQMAGDGSALHLPLLRAAGFALFVTGLVYAVAIGDPLRRWQIAAFGALLKLGIAAFLLTGIAGGLLPVSFAPLVLINEVVWLVAFCSLLVAAYRSFVAFERTTAPSVQRLAMRARTQYGMSLLEMSELSPVLVVFLRHLGCTFCRQTLADLANQRAEIATRGLSVVLVHMGPDEDAAPILERYNLVDIDRISDAWQSLYRAFGLGRGSLSALFGPIVLWKGLRACFLGGHGFSWPKTDPLQMPGVFVVYQGRVVSSYRYVSAADRLEIGTLVSSLSAATLNASN